MSAPVAAVLIAQAQTDGDVAGAIVAATQCLQRFTDAFNQHDLAGMDGQLHFPRQMWAGAEMRVWGAAG